MLGIQLADPAHPYTSDGLLAALGINLSAQTTSLQALVAPSSSAASPGPPELTRVCGDGERIDHLVRLAGSHISKGKSLEDVIYLCLGWNSQNSPPLDAANVISHCEGIWKSEQRNHPNRKPSTGPITPLFALSEVSIAAMLQTNPQPRRWLLDGVLPLGKVGALVAGGGTGKSQLLLQAGISVATGHALCETFAVGEQGAALLICAEDDIDEIHRRLERTLSHIRKIDPNFADSNLDQSLYIQSAVSINNLMTRTTGSRGVEPTDYVDRLILAANQIPNLKLIVIDPMSRFQGGNENAAEDITRMVEQLERVAAGTGATVLIAHHVNKSSRNDEDAHQGAARGSSAFSDGVRWQMQLHSLSSTKAKSFSVTPESKYRLLEAAITKNNYGKLQPPVTLYREDDGYITSARSTSVPMTLEDRIFAIVQRESQIGKFYSPNQFENQFGGTDEEIKIGKNKVRGAIKEMLDAKRIFKLRGSKNLSTSPVPALPVYLVTNTQQ